MKSYVISWLILYGRHVITMVLAGATFFKIVLLLSIIMSNERYMKHTTYRGVKPKSPRSINHTPSTSTAAKTELCKSTHTSPPVFPLLWLLSVSVKALWIYEKKNTCVRSRGKNSGTGLQRTYDFTPVLLLLYFYKWFADMLTKWHG